MTKLSEIINSPTKKAARPGKSVKKEMSKLEKLLCGSGTESVRPAKEILKVLEKGAFILDVRTIMEARRGIAPGAKNIPLLRLKRHLDELPRDKTIVTYCGTGARAGKAKDILETAGFDVVNGGSYEGILEMLGVK